jgi:Glycosyl transferases group 1
VFVRPTLRNIVKDFVLDSSMSDDIRNILVRRSTGDTTESDIADLDRALKVVRAQPDDARNWVNLARILVQLDDASPALIAMEKAVRGLGFSEPMQDGALMRMAWQTLADSEPRVAELLRPCPIFGPIARQLSNQAEQVIDGLIAHHRQKFDAGGLPLPAYLPKPVEGKIPADLRVMVIMASPMNRVKVTDLLDGIELSAFDQGIEILHFNRSNDLLYDLLHERDPNIVADAIAELDLELARFCPHIVMLDGNFLSHARTITPNYFADRHLWGFKLVVVIGDQYDTQPNFFDHWAVEADLVVAFNRRTTHFLMSEHAEKFLYWPCIPIARSHYQSFAATEKSVDTCLIGTVKAGRELMGSYIRSLGITGHIILHDRRNGVLSRDDYWRLTAQARTVINSGKVSNVHSMVTGRAFEGVVVKTLAIEEVGNDLDQVFIPWVHYAPFANLTQAAMLVQYFAKHEDTRKQMTGMAYDWLNTYFSPEQFWQTICVRLKLGQT